MQNEGVVVTDMKTAMRSVMIGQLRRLEKTTPDEWQRAVFEAVTGRSLDDVDMDEPENRAGYCAWIRQSFDPVVGELVEDGYAREVPSDDGEGLVLIPGDLDEAPGFTEGY